MIKTTLFADAARLLDDGLLRECYNGEYSREMPPIEIDVLRDIANRIVGLHELLKAREEADATDAYDQKVERDVRSRFATDAGRAMRDAAMLAAIANAQEPLKVLACPECRAGHGELHAHWCSQLAMEGRSDAYVPSPLQPPNWGRKHHVELQHPRIEESLDAFLLRKKSEYAARSSTVVADQQVVMAALSAPHDGTGATMECEPELTPAERTWRAHKGFLR